MRISLKKRAKNNYLYFLLNVEQILYKYRNIIPRHPASPNKRSADLTPDARVSAHALPIQKFDPLTSIHQCPSSFVPERDTEFEAN